MFSGSLLKKTFDFLLCDCILQEIRSVRNDRAYWQRKKIQAIKYLQNVEESVMK
jgi:hypothetical protein